MKYERKVNARGTSMVNAIVWMALGILFFLFPDKMQNIIMILIGAAALITGIFKIFSGFRKPSEDRSKLGDYAAGVIGLVIGILVLVCQKKLLSILPVVFGVFLLISSIIKIIDSVEMRKVSADKWWFSLIMACISAAFGFILIARPAFVVDLSVRLIGIFLVIDGIMNLISSTAVGYQYRNVRKSVSKTVYDAATGKVEEDK